MILDKLAFLPGSEQTEAKKYVVFFMFVLHEGRAQRGNQALIAAGTGLGEAGLIWDGKTHRPFASASTLALAHSTPYAVSLQPPTAYPLPNRFHSLDVTV